VSKSQEGGLAATQNTDRSGLQVQPEIEPETVGQNHPGYWKEYRKRHPDKAERNRILQAIRNRRARSFPFNEKMISPLIAKMDASKPEALKILGQFWIVPVIAKMDALRVNILKIPVHYP